jgi:hypothetical protein
MVDVVTFRTKASSMLLDFYKENDKNTDSEQVSIQLFFLQLSFQ